MSSKSNCPVNDNGEVEEVSVRLKRGFELREFLRTKQATFEVDLDYNSQDDNSNYFNPKDLENDVLDQDSGYGFFSDDEENSDLSTDLSPHERLQLKMTDISDGNKLVFKMIRKAGTDEQIPKDATVFIHYEAIAEYQDCPFDSTYLRNEPLKFRLDSGSVVMGLNLAVSTMKLKEISCFVVKSDSAYGPMGCPPRIPPDASIMYKVELLSIVDDGDAANYHNLDDAKREKLSFDRLCQFCNGEKEQGNHFFKLEMYGKAKACYGRMMRMLEDFHLQNDQEEAVQQKLLLKCYLNISVCALKLKNAPLVITMGNLARQIDPKNAKVFFRMGKAYKMLMDFDKAKIFMNKACAIEPSNSEILAEIKDLDQSFRNSKKMEKELMKKMFSGLTVDKQKS